MALETGAPTRARTTPTPLRQAQNNGSGVGAPSICHYFPLVLLPGFEHAPQACVHTEQRIVLSREVCTARAADSSACTAFSEVRISGVKSSRHMPSTLTTKPGGIARRVCVTMRWPIQRHALPRLPPPFALMRARHCSYVSVSFLALDLVDMGLPVRGV